MKGLKAVLHPPSSNSVSSRRGSTRRAASLSSSSSAFLCPGDNVCRNGSPHAQSLSPLSPKSFLHRSAVAFEDLRTFSDVPSLKAREDTRERSCGSKDLLRNQTTQEKESPPLLLEGDSYHISEDGVARTYYRLKEPPLNAPFSVEERFSLREARKTFVLRREGGKSQHNGYTSTRSAGSKREGHISLGVPCRQFTLQEIKSGVYAGTGATTWESSILMSMFFATQPHILAGDVIELGSGVGLGGILCAMHPWASSEKRGRGGARSSGSLMLSLTLSDCSSLVLAQCENNLKALRKIDDENLFNIPVDVVPLDWYNFLPRNQREKSTGFQKTFDTVLVCDCAYHHEAIPALACAIKSLLRTHQSEAHIFGPNNRSGLDELLLTLRRDHELRVTVETLEMQRFRLSPSDGLIPIENEAVLNCHYLASYESKFLHIVCSTQTSNKHAGGANLAEID